MMIEYRNEKSDSDHKKVRTAETEELELRQEPGFLTPGGGMQPPGGGKWNY